MVYSQEFNAISGSEAQKRAQQDFDDLQNEVAGRDVGRIERFLNGESNHPNSEKVRRKEREAEMTRFMALMSDPVYAKLYEDTGKALRETRIFVDNAREKLAEVRAEIAAERADLDAHAVRLPDGTLVYRGDDDRAYTRDGSLSQNPDAQNIIWREDNTRLSKSLRNDERGQKADGFERKLNNADQQLGAMENRYQDTENPLMPDDLQEMQEGLTGMRDSLDQDLKDFVSPSNVSPTFSDRPTPNTPFLPKGMIGMDAL